MKRYLLFFYLIIFYIVGFAQIKKQSSVIAGTPKDDPNKFVTFCMKDSVIDTIYIEIDNAICPGYTMDMTLSNIQASVSDSNLLEIKSVNAFVPNIQTTGQILIPIIVRTKSLSPNSLDRLVSFKVFFNPTNNAELKCSYTEQLINVLISQMPCDSIEIVFDTGKCNSCENIDNITPQLKPIKYAHFIVNDTSNGITFIPLCSGFEEKDSLIWILGNGDSVIYSQSQYSIIGNTTQCSTLSNGAIIYQYPIDSIYQVELVMKCAGIKECKYIVKRQITVINGSLSISDLQINELTIYPNPTQDIIYLEIEDNKRIKTQTILYNNTGYSAIQQWDNVPYQIDISSLPSGIYFIEIISNIGEVEVVKVIKQ